MGTGGTIIGTLVGGCVIDDLERMVGDAVSSLAEHLNDFDFTTWKQEWDSAHEPPLVCSQLSSQPLVEPALGEFVDVKDYSKRILGRWLGRRKYITFYADGRWGVQRNEDAPITIQGRGWRVKGNKLSVTWQGDTGVTTAESTIVSFRTKQFITEA